MMHVNNELDNRKMKPNLKYCLICVEGLRKTRKICYNACPSGQKSNFINMKNVLSPPVETLHQAAQPLQIFINKLLLHCLMILFPLQMLHSPGVGSCEHAVNSRIPQKAVNVLTR